MPKKLKVYRTPIGFHDAYVAAPSQNAALQAWGSDADLFARGVAELVTDPALTGEPLAKPGEVVRRVRGTAAEHVAALPKDKSKSKREASATKPARMSRPRARSPMPSRSAMEAAERALEAAEARQGSESDDLSRREKALAEERRKLEAAHRRETGKLQRALEQAHDDYRSAIDAWKP